MTTNNLRDDVRASALKEGDFFAEYGGDGVHKVAERDDHGDTVLITSESGTEFTLDCDEVVEYANGHPVEIEGTIILANGEKATFRIGDVAGDITYSQWGNVEDVLYCTVDLLQGLVEKIQEDDLLVVPQ